MKKLNILLTAMVVACLFICSTISVIAQSNPNHVYTINTQYMVTGQDSVAHAERDALLKEYLTKVTMKNEFVIHQWSLNHFYTDDSREFVTITEYANWSDIMKAGDRDSQLEKTAWPDEKKRSEFMKKMNSYFTYHKDAIFSGRSNLSK